MRKNRPTARILFLITLSRLMGTTLDADSSALSLSSSWVHILSIAATISLTVGHQQSPLNRGTMQTHKLTFLADKRQTPTECVHKVRKPVRVRPAVVLRRAAAVAGAVAVAVAAVVLPSRRWCWCRRRVAIGGAAVVSLSVVPPSRRCCRSCRCVAVADAAVGSPSQVPPSHHYCWCHRHVTVARAVMSRLLVARMRQADSQMGGSGVGVRTVVLRVRHGRGGRMARWVCGRVNGYDRHAVK
jgi:hypothetical protein